MTRVFSKIKITVYCLLLLSLVAGCDESYTPKPKGYFRIELPEKQYSGYEPQGCDYSFELPAYAAVAPYNDSVAEPCWKYIRFPRYKAEIFLSYKKVDNNVATYIEDAHTLAFKHSVKADIIDETLIETPNRVYGIIYDIGGNAASPLQFYVTDSTRHFIRGALYFNHPPQPDSLEPVVNFLREDVIRLVSTTMWK
jgi:gliding motility-associated lipoprotein GldD